MKARRITNLFFTRCHLKNIQLGLSISILYLSISLSGYSQCKEWKWPADKKTAEEKVALLQDNVNSKMYKQAIKPLNWLIGNAPELNSSIYIHGGTIYDALASKEKNAGVRKKLVDSLMIIYDLRLQQCGQKDFIANKKALSAFKFYINGPDVTRALALMDSAFALNGNKISDGTLFPYMQTLVVTQTKFKNLTEENILIRYETLTKITAFKIDEAKADPKRLANLQKIRMDIDEWLFKVIKPDCDFVKKNLAPKFEENPEDILLAKRIFSFMLQGKCTDDPLWLEAGEAIYSKEKDFGLAKNLALRYLALENNDKANKYLRESLSIASTRSDSSEIYYHKGSYENKINDRIEAREYYLKSVKLDSKRKDAYERIGDLYYESFNDCAQKQSQADDRAVFLAAYEYYAKAANQNKMAMAKKSFPSKEEIFLVNYKVDQILKVNCWINEEVIIKTRD